MLCIFVDILCPSSEVTLNGVLCVLDYQAIGQLLELMGCCQIIS